jgi:hypothetical protein
MTLSEIIQPQDFSSLYPSKEERLLEKIKSELDNEYQLLELKHLLDKECSKIFNEDFYRDMLIELIGSDKMIPTDKTLISYKVYIKKDNWNFMTICLGTTRFRSKEKFVSICLYEDEFRDKHLKYTSYDYMYIDKDSPKMLSELIKSLNII